MSSQRRSASGSRRTSSASSRRRPASASSRRAGTGSQRVRRTIRPSAADRFKRKLPFIIAAVALILLVWGGLTVKHWAFLRHYDKNKIVTTVKIGPVDVSGMTKKQAADAVKDYMKLCRKSTMTLAVGDDSAQLDMKDCDLTIKNKTKMAEKALAYGSKGSVNQRYKKIKALEKEPYVVPLRISLDEKKTGELIQEECSPYLKGPKNATLEVKGDKIKTTKGKSGIVVDNKKTVSSIVKKINSNWNGGEVVAKVYTKKVEPDISEKELKKLKDVLGTYETSFAGSEEGREQNISNGVSLINGSVVKPGETFSADEAMRPYTEDHGYTRAGSYENGDVVDSLGGGICQVSTTLYNAVLYAELEVVQRQSHSMRVPYVDPGRDAAIAGDVKDFKFKNNTKHPIYIYGYVKNEAVTMSIYGIETRPKDREVEFDSQILESEENKTIYKTDSSMRIGSMITEVPGHRGCKAKLWKIVKENGKEDKEEINYSEYKNTDTIILVGTKTDNIAAAERVIRAVDTQDEAKIRAAIAGAR